MQGTGRVTGRVVKATVLVPPGQYGDGPVYLRVEKALAGSWRPPSGYRVERNDWRCSCDPRFDYIEIENTHNAFLYLKEMHGQGIPAAALAVVRLAKARTTS